MIALIQALMTVLGLIATVTTQGAFSPKGDDRSEYVHHGNKLRCPQSHPFCAGCGNS
jgi:hypothetical protein